jgi:hypothetical protein
MALPSSPPQFDHPDNIWRRVQIIALNSLKLKLVLILFKHSVCTAKKTQHITITKLGQLMLFEEIIAVYPENHKKLTNTLCGRNAELLIVKASGTYSSHQVKQCFVFVFLRSNSFLRS